MPKSAAERNRECRERKRDGTIRLVLFANRDWLAEMLFEVGGFCGIEEEDRQELEAGAQRLIDFLIDEVKETRAIRVTQRDF